MWGGAGDGGQCSAQPRAGAASALSAHHTGRLDLLQHTLHHHPGVMPRGSPGMGRRGRWQFHRAVWVLLWSLHMLFPLLGTPPPSMKLGILISCRGPSPTITHSESLPGSLFKGSGVSLVAQ